MCASRSARAHWGLCVCQPELLEPSGGYVCASQSCWSPLGLCACEPESGWCLGGECMSQPEWLEPYNKCIIIFHSMSLAGLCQVAMLVVPQ